MAAWIAPAIMAAGSLISQLLANRQAKKAREYNSPQQQMQRLSEAKLNPNLIYGNSPQGITGEYEQADQTIMPQGIGNAFNQYVGQQKVEMDQRKLESLLQTQETERIAKMQGVAESLQRTEGLKYDLGFRQKTAEYASEQMRLNMLQTGQALKAAQQNYTIINNQEARNAASFNSNMQEQLIRMASMRLAAAKTKEETKYVSMQLENLGINTKILGRYGIVNASQAKELNDTKILGQYLSNDAQQLDNNMRRLGLTPNSDYILQLNARLINGEITYDEYKKMIKTGAVREANKGLQQSIQGVIPSLFRNK